MTLQLHEKEKGGTPGVVTPDYSTSTWKGEAGRLPEVQGRSGLYRVPTGRPSRRNLPTKLTKALPTRNESGSRGIQAEPKPICVHGALRTKALSCGIWMFTGNPADLQHPGKKEEALIFWGLKVTGQSSHRCLLWSPQDSISLGSLLLSQAL